MKADVSQGSNPTKGEVTTTGSLTTGSPADTEVSGNGSAALEVGGPSGESTAGADIHARPTVPVMTFPPRELTSGPLRRQRQFKLPTIPGLSLDDRSGRLALSIVLAMLLWFYVLNLENPEQTTPFKGLTVDVRGTGPALKVVNSVPTVDSVVQAPQSMMVGLSAADIRPYIDLSGLGQGVHDVPVRVEINGGRTGPAQVTLTPRTIQVQLEAHESATREIIVLTTGTPAFGYVLQQAQVTPGEVKVIGSQDALSRIAQVVAPVDVGEKAQTQRGFITPSAIDAEGRPVSGLSFEPETVEVVVPIQLLYNYKVVAIRVPVVGQPASGYGVGDIKINPTTVTVCCDPGVLDPLQLLDTEPVTITGTTTTLTTTAELILPQGVELYPGQKRTVDVRVTVQRLESTLQVSVAPTVEGLPEDYSAVVSPNNIELVLSGTFSQLQSLNPADVRALVSMQGREPGTYELQPQIILPVGVTLEGASPDRITVTITAPTPVPPTATTQATVPATTQPTAAVPATSTSAAPTPTTRSTPSPAPLTVTPLATEAAPTTAPPTQPPASTPTSIQPDALPSPTIP